MSLKAIYNGHFLHFVLKTTGQQCTFIDINWGHKNWPQSLPMFANFARDVHMPIGIIYNAAPPDKIMTNEQWLQDAERNFTYIEHTIGIVSDWAIFASWVKISRSGYFR